MAQGIDPREFERITIPQGRVTDERITLTLHKLDTILEGQDLNILIEALTAEEKTKQLLEG